MGRGVEERSAQRVPRDDRAERMGGKRCCHGKLKGDCVECDPCPHGKVKINCTVCKPCPHGKVKRNCAACNPCPHGKQKGDCAACNTCPHGKVKRDCTACSGCRHGKLKRNCVACKITRVGQPSSKRVKREPESSPEIKLELEIKQEPQPFTICGYFGFDDGQ